MSLRQIGKATVSEMVEQTKSAFPWKVLVVDDFGLKVLGSFTKLFDLTADKISVIEKLTLKRKPIRDMDAIYFVAPTDEVVSRILDDFSSSRLYNACHLFFTSTLPDDLFQRLSTSQMAKHIKTLREANTEFLILESQVFMTDIVLDPTAPLSFTTLISPSFAKMRKQELTKIGKRVATFCSTIGEYPIIRYHAVSIATSDGPLAKAVAAAIQDQIDTLYRLDSEAVASDRPRAIMLVLDRSFDLNAPFLHELTYQAMVNDLLEVEGGKYKQKLIENGKQTTKLVPLDEDDERWNDLRHRHIADCAAKIGADFKAFVSQNQALKDIGKSDAKAKNLKDIGALMRAAPQYTSQLTQYSLHLGLTQEAIDTYNNRKIAELAEIEQCLATKENSKGEAFKTISIDEMAAVVNVPPHDENAKVRLCCLYVVFKGGISKEEKNMIADKMALSSDAREILDNFISLGIKPEFTKAEKKTKSKAEDTYELSRYVPKLKKILEQMAEGELNTDEFPYFKETPIEDERQRGVSMRTAKSNWAKGQKKEESSNKGPRLLVYIAGGMTYSEIRSIYEITSREIYLGSTSVLKPNDFLAALKTLTPKSN